MRAFPTKAINDYGHEIHREGMWLRDYFAAKAMQGLLAADSNIPFDVTDEIGLLTKTAYAVADSMMEARK